MVIAKKVSYSYPDKTLALSEVSFEIKEGEFVGILGENGAGKSTLFKSMLGLIHPCEGHFSLAGIEVNSSNLNKLYKNIGYVFQNSNDQLFMPNVYDEIAYGPNNLGLKKNEVHEAVLESLNAVDMSQMIKKEIHTLSAGQKKRIAIAGILAMSPKIILLDEPVAGLDPMGVHNIMKLLKKLNKTRKITILMATHNVNLMPLFMDKAIIMKKGKILCWGTPEEVFNDSSDILEPAGLKLPEVTQLMKELNEEHNLSLKQLPLTISEAKEVLRTCIANPPNNI